MPDVAPLVDAVEILRLVGSGAFERGREYFRAGAVVETTWSATDRTLTATVRGSTDQPYRCSVDLSPDGGNKVWPLSSTCTCAVERDCKHVVAALLKSNADVASGRIAPAPVAEPVKSWKTTVGALSGVAAASDDLTRLGLLFELREQVKRSRSRWNAPVAKTALAPLDESATYRLGVRPVTLSATGSWVRSTVTWNSISYQANRLSLSVEQQRWFGQFAALHRSNAGYSTAQEPDWLYLDDFESPLLWNVLKDAAPAAISFVTGKKDRDVLVADLARISMDVSRAEHGLLLTPALTIDDVQHPATFSGTIGDHGLYTFSLTPKPRFTIAPTKLTITAEQHQLLRSDPLAVPLEEVDEFLGDYYPGLTRVVDVTSADNSVEFPEVAPPIIVLTVTFAPKHSLHVAWAWEFGGVQSPLAFGLVPQEIEQILGASPRAMTIQGIDAAEFVATVMPALAAREDLRVDIVGKQLNYSQLTDVPRLVVKTVETHKRDWFDLGMVITVEGRDIPFGKVFAALSKGQTKLLLVDNSYLSLKQPVFDGLRALLSEAEALAEWDTGKPLISRYQASFWEELEELADDTEQAVAWRSAISGLTATFEPTALPVGLTAELRPYQQEGFDWLAFLWKNQLGGVLADDMGLGKTIQALALVQHAGARDPFLVVAPTSVVSNWAAESARFTPGLRVATVTTTKQPIPADVDIVVTSYALLRLDFANYQGRTWAGLILDEAQFVKNRQSKAHECAVELDVPFKLAITGTPMENSLMDLWSLFHITAPGLFPSATRFIEHYEKPIGNANGEVLARLRRRIRPLMMRRTKELVAADLPPKQEQVLWVDLAPKHRKLYDTFLQKERQKLLGLIDDLDRNRFIVFRSLTLLRMLSLDAGLVGEEHAGIPSSKLDVLMQNLDDVVAEGHRALVFSQFTSYLSLVAERLTEEGVAFEYLDGSTRKRADVIDRFRGGVAPIFLISLKAGGFGLNLTEADYVFLLDPWWNPATETQAIDRTHRIGQSKNVMVYRLVARDTIEEKVMALKDAKAKLFDQVMDDDAVFSSALTADDIRGLLD